MKTPTWTEVRDVLKYDGWVQDKQRSIDHDYFEKDLGSEFLVMHVSRSGDKTMSPGRFKAILADQMQISEAQFWDVARTKKPPDRPAPAPESLATEIPFWLAQALHRAGATEAELEGLDQDEAQALLDQIRSKPQR